ncbi:MAG: low affinity iron permease family protein [Pseudonocardiaceae bacterium]
MNGVGKPCAGKPHARFDGRELETRHHRPRPPQWDSLAGNRRHSRLRGLQPARCPRASSRPSFDRFVQAVYRRVSRTSFFVLCVGIVVAWLVSFPLWEDLKEWQTVIHTVASVLTLLLVALLENASRRAEEAAQEKLNVIAEALAELMSSEACKDPDLRDAVDRLRQAVGLEERH